MTDFLPFLPGFLAAYAILIVGASSPGPAVAMLLGIAMGQGRAAALVASMGIATGSVVLNVGTLAGVGLILTQAAWAMAVLRVIGGAYLLWLAFGAFRKAVHPPSIDAAPVAPRSMWRHFLKGSRFRSQTPRRSFSGWPSRR